MSLILVFLGNRHMPDYSISHQHKLSSNLLQMKNERFHEPHGYTAYFPIMSSFSTFYTNQMKILDVILKNKHGTPVFR